MPIYFVISIPPSLSLYLYSKSLAGDSGVVTGVVGFDDDELEELVGLDEDELDELAGFSEDELEDEELAGFGLKMI